MVVCVSPATGSFMGWRVEKIDVAYPFQALTTRFVLKLPWLVLEMGGGGVERYIEYVFI